MGQISTIFTWRVMKHGDCGEILELNGVLVRLENDGIIHRIFQHAVF